MDAKSRLAPVLAQPARRELALLLLKRTLRVLAEVAGCDQRVVVSASSEVLSTASEHDCLPVRESPHENPGAVHAVHALPDVGGSMPDRFRHLDHRLNAAIQLGADYAFAGGADAILIVPADLPFLDPSALTELVLHAAEQPGIVIAPDKDRNGTNVLLVRPPLATPFLFGPDSFSRHRKVAAALGLACVVHQAEELAIDLDTPENLEEILRPDAAFPLDAELARFMEVRQTAQGWSA